MESPAPPPFFLPPFFTVFCILAAMTMVVAPIVWIRKCYSEAPPAHDLGREVLIRQFRTLAIVLVLSFLINLWRLAEGSPKASVTGLLPELLLLAFMGWRYLTHTKGTGLPKGQRLGAEARRVLRQFGLCLAGWAATFGVGAGVYWAFLLVTKNDEVSVTAAGFAAGIFWIVAVTVAYFFKRPPVDRLPEQMRRVKSYDLLWPVMLAYILLLAPMTMQEIGNSEKFHEMMHSKRPPRKI
jgi:hypothetical protein